MRCLLVLLSFWCLSARAQPAIPVRDSVVVQLPDSLNDAIQSVEFSIAGDTLVAFDRYGADIYLINHQGVCTSSIDLQKVFQKEIFPQSVGVNGNNVYAWIVGGKYQLEEKGVNEDASAYNVGFLNDTVSRYTDVFSSGGVHVDGYHRRFYMPVNVYRHAETEADEMGQAFDRQTYKSGKVAVYRLDTPAMTFEQEIVFRPNAQADWLARHPQMNRAAFSFADSAFAVAFAYDSLIRIYDYAGGCVDSFGRRGALMQRTDYTEVDKLPTSYFNDGTNVRSFNRRMDTLRRRSAYYGELSYDRTTQSAARVYSNPPPAGQPLHERVYWMQCFRRNRLVYDEPLLNGERMAGMQNGSVVTYRKDQTTLNRWVIYRTGF